MGVRYRKVDPRIWNDEKFQSLPPLDKLLAVYCLTAQTNRIGIFKFSIALAAEDLGMEPDEVRQRLDRVSDTLSWPYDSTRRVLYLPNWWKYNNPGSSKTMAGILSDVHEVPQTELLKDFASNTRYLSDSLSDTLCDFFGKGMPYQEQEQEQEQEEDANASSSSKNSKPRSKKTPEYDVRDMQCAGWIWGLIEQLQPERKKPNFEKWANTVRLIRVVDKRSYQDIRELFEWVNRDSFWRTVILSPDKLRDKWDDLALKKKTARTRHDDDEDEPCLEAAELDRRTELARERERRQREERR